MRAFLSIWAINIVTNENGQGLLPAHLSLFVV